MKPTLLVAAQCAAYVLTVVVALHLSVLPWPVEHLAELAAVLNSSAGILMQLNTQFTTNKNKSILDLNF